MIESTPIPAGLSARDRIRVVKDARQEIKRPRAKVEPLIEPESTPSIDDLLSETALGDEDPDGIDEGSEDQPLPQDPDPPEEVAKGKEGTASAGRPKTYNNARKWPVMPAVNMDWKAFEMWTAKFTWHHWSHFDAYLYRMFPVIHREPKYIDTFPGTESEGKHADLTMEAIRKKHGGGKYKFHIRDADQDKEVAYVKFEIPIADCDPKLNLFELDTVNKLNRAYVDMLIRRGALNHDGTVKENQAMGSQTNVAEVLTAVSGFMKQQGGGTGDGTSAILLTMLKELLAQNSNKPSEVAKITELITLLSATSKKEDNSMLPMLQMMQQQMADANQRFMLLLEKVMQPPPVPVAVAPVPGSDPVDQMDKMLACFTKFKEATASNSNDEDGEPRRRKSTLETVLDKLPDLFAPLAQLGGAYLMSKGVDPAVVEQITNAATDAAGGSSGTVTPSNGGQQGMQPTTGKLDPKAVGGLLKMYGQNIINAVYTGKNGAMFADSIVNLIGEDAFIRNFSAFNQIPVPQLVAMMKQHPEFWQNMAPREVQLTEFLEDFMGWPDTLPEDEDDIPDEKLATLDETHPAKVKATAKRKVTQPPTQ